MKRFLIALLPFLFAFHESRSQSLGTEIGIGAGASIYQGDLSPHWLGSYSKPNPSFQLFAQENLFPLVAIRAGYAFAPVRDDEKNYEGGVHKFRNFAFSANIHEFSAQLVINPQMSNGEEEVGNIHPYLFVGIGFAFTQIQRNWNNFNYSFPYWQSWVLPGLQTDSLKKMPTSVVTMPVGMGIRYQLSDGIAIYGEVNKRIARTEYLDGFSKSANRNENDGFASITIGLILRRSDLGGGILGGFGGGGFGGGRGGGFGGYGSGGRNRARTDCPKNVF